jgi:uncharacterized protein
MMPNYRMGDWVNRPQRNIAAEVLPFWKGLRRHQFLLCTCRRCERRYWPFTVCIDHDDIPDFEEMAWLPASGSGAVFAHSTVHKVIDSAYQADVPYVLAMIELDEGPLFPSRLLGCEPRDVSIGMRVRVEYIDAVNTGVTYPFFVPFARGEAT